MHSASPIQPLRIAPWPDDHGNPYQRLFYGALEQYGVRAVAGLCINDGELKRLAKDLDVVHLHWPEYAWRVSGDGLAAQLRLIVGLARFLRLARRLGIRIWWTAHNLVPHEGNPLINWLGIRVVAAHADLIIAHSAFAAAEVKRRFRAHSVVVMPHGNFSGAYPRPRPRAEVMAQLGLDPALPLLACLGGVRRYKGIMTAIDAVACLGGRVQLVVAGDPKPCAQADEIAVRAQTAPWLRVLLRRTSDQEFADFSAASEAVLLPYLSATTSGVLFAAWLFERGVIASDIPCFSDELADFPGAGILAPVGDPAAFGRAIEQYLSRSPDERSAAARAAAAAHDWDRCVLPLVELLGIETRLPNPTSAAGLRDRHRVPDSPGKVRSATLPTEI
jgi:beta-1,4-mannosyltransferase